MTFLGHGAKLTLTSADVVLLATSIAAAAGLMVWSAVEWAPVFDEFWHLYFAEVEPLGRVFDEIRHETHPPLSYFLWRLFTEPGQPVWHARIPTAIAGLGSLPLLWATAVRLDVSRPLAHTGVFLLAVMPAFVQVSVSIRSYSLTLFALLLAVYTWLRIWQADGAFQRRDIALLLLAVVLVPWTTYTGALPLAAWVAAAVLIAIAHPTPRRATWQRLGQLRPWPELALTAIALAGVAPYFLWTRRPQLAGWTGDHFPADGEGTLVFLVRGINRDLTAFCPLPVGDSSWWGPLVLLAVVGLTAVPALLRRRSDGMAAIPGLVTAGTLLLLFGAALAGKHPFGGDVRHQFVALPFLHLTVLLAANALVARSGVRWTQPAMIVVLLASYGIWTVQGYRGPHSDHAQPTRLMESSFSELVQQLDAGEPIYARNFSFVGLYANTRDQGPWQWRRAHRLSDDTLVDVFDINIGGKAIIVMRHGQRGRVPLTADDALVDDLRSVLELEQLASLWVWPQPIAGTTRAPAGRRATVATQLEQRGLRLIRWAPTPPGEAWCVGR